MEILIIILLIVCIAQSVSLYVLNNRIKSLQNSNSELYKQNKQILESISILYEDVDVDMVTLKSEVNSINTRCGIIIDTVISELYDKRKSSESSS